MSHARLQPALVRSLFRSGGCLDLITIPHIFFFLVFLMEEKEQNSKSHEYLWEKNQIIEGEMKYGCRVCVNTHESMCAHSSHYVTRQLLYNARCESYFSQEFFADLVRETGFSSYPFKNYILFFQPCAIHFGELFLCHCHPLSSSSCCILL